MTLPAPIISLLEKNPITLVDAGARNGVVDFKQLVQWIKVNAFEPDIEEALHLEKLNNTFEFYLVHPLALSDVAGKRKLHLARKRSFSSFFPFDRHEFLKHFGRMADHQKWMDGFVTEHTVEIDCVTLDSMFSPGTIDYLKIDTQGTELEILQGAKQLLINKNINIIQVEVNMQPVYAGQPTFSVVDQFLREAGFLLVDYKINPHAFSTIGSNAATTENPRIANGGDAVYVLDLYLLHENERNDRALKAALLLAHKGYLSIAAYLLETFTATKQVEIDQVFSALNTRPGKLRRKELARKWLPPAIIDWLKKS